MTASILVTKLFIPPTRPELVARPRLIEQLNGGLHRKLTIISAPAGFGKTTLVTEWVDSLQLNTPQENQIENKIAWLSLDERDNDPTRFLIYLIAALRTNDANIAKGALSALQSPQPPPNEDILITLINEISAYPDQMIIVLDDYHLIEGQPVHEALTFLLENQPPHLHLVIPTREDPPFPLARLRARGQLNELRAADLRFTYAEAAKFLNQAMGLDLSAEDITALERRTEGWIAGLQLAAISMRGREDAASLIKSFTGSHHLVLDYLIEDVLNQQSEMIQNFLVQTSLLDQLTGSLCDALTSQDNGQATLEMLDRANLFIISLDDERRWYRYHHLFADLLRQRLRQTQSEQFPILHERASEWFEQNGLADYAIEHALRAKNFERAADLIEEFAEDISQLGEHTKLRRWLDGLPVDMIFSRPHLCILDAEHLLTNGQIDKADIVLQAAEQSLESSTSFESVTPLDEPNQQLVGSRMKLQGRAALVRAHLVHFKGDAEGALKYARLALEYLPESDSTWRSTAFDCIGNAYSWLGDVVSAYQSRSEAFEASKAVGNIYMILFSSLKLVVTLRDLGCLQKAIKICQHQLKIANQSGLSQTAVVGWLYTLWGEVLAEKNELDRAIQLVLKGVKLTEQGKDVTFLGSSYLCLVRVLFSRGDMDHANEIIQEVDDLTLKQNLSPWIMNQMAAWQARIWLAQGKLDSSNHWVRDLELDVDGALSTLYDFDYVVLARILIAKERLDETSKLLQRLLKAAEAGGRTSKVIEILMLQALAFQASDDTGLAIKVLEKALNLAEPGGFIRIFVDEGPPMASLLYEALSRGIAPDYVRRLLAAFPVIEPEKSDPSESQVPGSDFVEPLSEREIEVLQLIAEGFTNQEIATQLYISLNTVKVHTRNINGKLGAKNRTGAVVRARTLGILQPT